MNANCDSTKPRTRRELLNELDVWDKAQGRQISNSSNQGINGSSVMSKDFDGAAWTASHNEDFKALIANARRKATAKIEHTSNTDGTSALEPDRNEKMSIEK